MKFKTKINYLFWISYTHTHIEIILTDGQRELFYENIFFSNLIFKIKYSLLQNKNSKWKKRRRRNNRVYNQEEEVYTTFGLHHRPPFVISIFYFAMEQQKRNQQQQ